MIGVRESVDASGGGTRPYNRRPGRTRSYHTPASRRIAALLAAWRYGERSGRVDPPAPPSPPAGTEVAGGDRGGIVAKARSNRARCSLNRGDTGSSAVAKCV